MVRSFYGLLSEQIIEKEKEKASSASSESKENNMIKEYFLNTAFLETHFIPSKNILDLIFETGVKTI